MGNHDFWKNNSNSLENTQKRFVLFKQLQSTLKNIVILDVVPGNYYDFAGYRFIGCEGYNIAENEVNQKAYKKITNKESKEKQFNIMGWRANEQPKLQDFIKQKHQEFLSNLETYKNDKTILLTHEQMFYNTTIVDTEYLFILYGHNHRNYCYNNVITNQVGYYDEEIRFKKIDNVLATTSTEIKEQDGINFKKAGNSMNKEILFSFWEDPQSFFNTYSQTENDEVNLCVKNMLNSWQNFAIAIRAVSYYLSGWPVTTAKANSENDTLSFIYASYYFLETGNKTLNKKVILPWMQEHLGTQNKNIEEVFDLKKLFNMEKNSRDKKIENYLILKQSENEMLPERTNEDSSVLSTSVSETKSKTKEETDIKNKGIHFKKNYEPKKEFEGVSFEKAFLRLSKEKSETNYTSSTRVSSKKNISKSSPWNRTFIPTPKEIADSIKWEQNYKMGENTKLKSKSSNNNMEEKIKKFDKKSNVIYAVMWAFVFALIVIIILIIFTQK